MWSLKTGFTIQHIKDIYPGAIMSHVIMKHTINFPIQNVCQNLGITSSLITLAKLTGFLKWQHGH